MPNPAIDTEDEDLIDDALDGADEEAGGDGDDDGSEAGGDTDEEGGGGTEGASDGGADGEGSETDEGQLVISLGDDADDDADAGDGKAAPPWIKQLRKENRDKDRRIRDLERQVQTSAPAVPVIGPEPSLAGCDHDEEKFKQEYTAWTARKVKAEAAASAAETQRKQQEQNWTRRLASVDVEEQRMKLLDRDEAREAFETQLTPLQQAFVLDGPDDPKTAAMLRYAIGRNPSVAARLAKIENPVKFTFAIAELVGKMKAVRKGAPPKPESRPRGSAAGHTAVDGALAKLEAEAARTGDRTKVAQYHRTKMKAAAA